MMPPVHRDRRWQTSAAALAVGALATLAPVAGQQLANRAQWPTFSTDVQYVEIDVRVTDAQGRFVRTLTPADFIVTDDGRRQTIAAFQLIDLPQATRAVAAAPPPARTEPDVSSNHTVAEARIFVIVLDDLHIDAARTAPVRTAVRQFLERYIAPTDLVSIVHTSGRGDAAQEFTSRPSWLVRAADAFIGRKLPSSTLARQEQHARDRDQDSRADVRVEHAADPLDAERGRDAAITLDTLRRVGQLLVDGRGYRKTLVLISEGLDYDVLNRSAQTRSGLSTLTARSAGAVAAGMQEAVAALTRANVTVYGIDPRGFATGGDVLIESAAPPQNPALALGPSSIQDEVLRAQASLTLLSEETGGLAAVTSNGIAQAFDRIMQESSTYYLLAYQPTPARYDGKFKRVDVRVAREGLRVRARQGYVAPASRAAARPPSPEMPGRLSPPLQRLLNSPVPVGGIPLRATAAPFKGQGRQASVLLTVEIDARDFRFLEVGGVHTDRIEAAVVAVDSRADRLRGDRHDVTLRLKPETYAAVRSRGVRLLFRLDLPPGRHQVRAAVSEEGGGGLGSVHCDVDVPDFAALPLASSGIVLTSTHAAGVATPRTDRDIQQLLTTPPTSAREFASADAIAAAFALYQRPGAQVGAVDVTTSVIDEHGAVRFTKQEQASQAELDGAPDGYGYVVTIPLENLAPGPHLLRVDVVSRTNATIAARRELPFRVTEP